MVMRLMVMTVLRPAETARNFFVQTLVLVLVFMAVLSAQVL
jgi:hypothetical protein